MAFANGKIINGDDFQARQIGRRQRGFQMRLVNGFDRFPMQIKILRYMLDGQNPAQPSDTQSQTPGHPVTEA